MSDQGRKAVVFGGSGFIGTHLVKRLAADGWHVLVVDLLPPQVPDIAFQVADVRERIDIDRSWDGATVFNLAAVHRTPGHADYEYYDTNVWGAINVCDWASRAGVGTVVFTSSIAVYGPGEDLKTEESVPRPTIAYGRSKLQAERIHETWREVTAERRLITVRPAVVFGPGENGNFTRLAEALRRRRFLYPGRRDTIKACGYVDDLVGAMLFALQDAPSLDRFNFCFPERYSIQDICEALNRIAGFQLPRGLPAKPTQVLLGTHLPPPLSLLQQRARKLVTSTNIAPRALQQSGFTWNVDLRSALERWGEQTRGAFV